MSNNTFVSLTEITNRTIGNFQNQIFASRLNPELLIFDMESVSLVDSFGLRSMLSALRQIRENGGELVLCHVQPTVMTILELTEMDKVFRISNAV